MKKELIFVLDPMCSWCWGFAPVIEQLRETQADNYNFSLVMGGLRTKGDIVWDESSKGYLKGHMVCQKGYRSILEIKKLLES